MPCSSARCSPVHQDAATDGRALAFRLAAAGLGLVLGGRSADKQPPCRPRPGVQVRTFVLDFTGDGLAAKADVLGEFLAELDVDVLVNSADTCYPYVP